MLLPNSPWGPTVAGTTGPAAAAGPTTTGTWKFGFMGPTVGDIIRGLDDDKVTQIYKQR